MVFKKLLAGLGLGGVEVDTVLSPHPAAAGGQLTGQVNLRAKSDTDITAITLHLVATGPMGEVDLGQFPVAQTLRASGGTAQQVPFSIPLPPHAPFTVLYGQPLPGISLGIRTALSVTSGSAKGDFDPVQVEASAAYQHIMDALGAIGCRFVRNELRPGHMIDLPVPAAQAITFYAPVPEGQQPGPHIPQVTFTLAGNPAGITVLAQLAGRPGSPDRHELTDAAITRLESESAGDGWTGEVDRWLIAALEKLDQPAAAAPEAFMQPHAPGQMPQQPHIPQGQQPGYAYAGQNARGRYKYSGYRGRPSMAGAVAAGVGGAALGFLGGMMIGNMIDGALTPDATDAAGLADPGVGDPGMGDAGSSDAGYEDFGGDFGGDFGF